VKSTWNQPTITDLNLPKQVTKSVSKQPDEKTLVAVSEESIISLDVQSK
jgi:hypothetical protein